MQKNRIKSSIIICGMATLIGNSIVLYITWLHAFINGEKTLITINSYGEQSFEFFLLPITIFIGLWSAYCLMFKGRFVKQQ